MSDCIDLDAYFERIGWGWSSRPDVDTLAGLLRAQIERIPFENLDVLLGRPIRLDLASLQDKLVRRRRGGYCFEHATLFAAVLESLGFAPVRHSARVVLVVPRGEATRSHMFLTVPLEGAVLVADPGFGGLAPRVPLPLAVDAPVTLDGDRHWLGRDDGAWVMRARSAGRDVDCWVSTLERDNRIDFEVANYYVATHPASPFVNRLMLRAYTPYGRVHVMNREVREWRDGMLQTWELADRRALRDLLARAFGIDLPEVETVRVPMIAGWD
jgi:N-hydroxyarylamine O-acetyltransferase